MVLLLAISLPAGSQEPAHELQQRVKAAFLYKFLSYADWPNEAYPSPGTPIVIGVAGADGLAKDLEAAVAGREVARRPLAVRRLQPGDPVRTCCLIVFV